MTTLDNILCKSFGLICLSINFLKQILLCVKFAENLIKSFLKKRLLSVVNVFSLHHLLNIFETGVTLHSLLRRYRHELLKQSDPVPEPTARQQVWVSRVIADNNVNGCPNGFGTLSAQLQWVPSKAKILKSIACNSDVSLWVNNFWEVWKTPNKQTS